ncbi:MAG: carbohydrate kinase [Candidatus Heimdallarchaeota archaeon]
MSFPEVLSIGEILIDFISDEIGTLDKVNSFQKCPGGAPANFIVGLARLGINTGFIGKVANDFFGDYLLNILKEEGVNVEFMVKAKSNERTTLAFVSLDQDSERDFLFYRKDAADMKLEPEEVNLEAVKKAQFLNFGTVSLTDEPCRSATFKAIEECRKTKGKVCLDPNIRLDLWVDKNELRNMLDQALLSTDIFYPSTEELQFILDDEEIDEQKAVDEVFEKYPINIIALKKGNEGCLVKQRDGFFSAIPSFEVPVIDTTGAGDGFNAGFVFGLLDGKSLEEAGILGCAVGALAIQKKGAMTSLPTREELNQFLINQKVKIPL